VAADSSLPEWERLLSAERHLQYLVPGTVLVGGTAASLHAGHRVSLDGDHVLTNLRDRFDQVLSDLEAAAGWKTDRIQRPVLILGSLDGVLTGIRQLRRTAPLETEEVQGLRIPTLPEMARIKAWLLATRHTVRDYLDTVVLFERLGREGVVAALRNFDSLYARRGSRTPCSSGTIRSFPSGPDPVPRAEDALELLGACRRARARLGQGGGPTEHGAASMTGNLSRSRALWNWSSLDLANDEQLAQILDRGTMDDWRELYQLAKGDPELRGRLVKIISRVPLPLPRFWLAARAALGEEVDLSAPLPSYADQGI
jgi:hypothetical protein